MGGAERFYIRLVNSLHRAGVPVAAVTTAGGEISNGIDPSIPQYHAPQWAIWDLYSRWKINQAIRHFKPDIIQTYMGRATRIVNLPKGSSPIHIARLGGYYNLKGYRHAHAWVANTEGIRRYLVDSGLTEERVTHIGNFVDIPIPSSPASLSQLKKQFNIPPDAICILGLGRHHVNKGWADLLNAFALLPPTHNHQALHLVMVGDGPLNSALKHQAARLGISPRVTWAGWQKNPAPWYQLAKVFVCASHHEPLGNVILEAWANQTLIVSTRSQGPLELIENGVDGLLIPIGNPAGMAATITQALTLSDYEYKKLTSSGLKKLKDNFSEKAIVQRYIDFYSALLNKQA